MNIFIQILWFLLPAATANMSAALSAKFFPRWRLPIDFYHTFNERRIFGNHKTVRGILFGLTASVVVFAIERELFYSYVSIRSLSIIDYSHMTLAFGFALGVGGLGGDLARSFLKRQLGIAPGKPWVPFDQVDWILGALFASLIFVKLSLSFFLASLVIGFFVHMIVKIIGRLLKVDNAWL